MELIVLFWDDGTKNVFCSDSSRDINSFVAWKESKGITLAEIRDMTKEDYKNLIDK